MIGRITLAALACVSVFALHTGAAWAFSLTVTPSPQPAAETRSSAKAAATTSPDLTTIRITGMFEEGDSAKLREVILRERAPRLAGGKPIRLVVELSSSGGDVYEGLKVGYLFREFDIATLVRKGDICLSSCAFAFLGGTETHIPTHVPGRTIEVGGEVGFHAFWLNASGVKRTPDDGSSSDMTKGFNLARGGSALLMRYAATMNIDPLFVARLLGRPPEEWEFVNSNGEFVDLMTCARGVDWPAAPQERIAVNICNHAMNWTEGSEALQSRPMSEGEAKRDLLKHVQARLDLYGIKGPIAAQIATALASRGDRGLDQPYADLMAAGLPLPEIVGPAFEVSGYSAGAYDVQCHVSFSLKDPDRYDLTLAAEAGLVRSTRQAPRQCRRLYLFDRQDVLNPRKR